MLTLHFCCCECDLHDHCGSNMTGPCPVPAMLIVTIVLTTYYHLNRQRYYGSSRSMLQRGGSCATIQPAFSQSSPGSRIATAIGLGFDCRVKTETLNRMTGELGAFEAWGNPNIANNNCVEESNRVPEQLDGGLRYRDHEVALYC